MSDRSPTTVRSAYDVVVAGARAAGAATALLLAREGLDVLVVDPMRRGTDTLSTHALMRAGVLQLHRWGLLDTIRAADTPVIRTTTFHYGGPGHRTSISLDIEPRDGIDGLYAPRRTVLDPTLADAAEAAGAHFAFGHAVRGVVTDAEGRVRGVEVRDPSGEIRPVRAELVVGADGMRSTVARNVGARTLHRSPETTATIYAHVPGLDRPGFEWYFAEDSAIGTIATNEGDTCVYVGMPPARLLAERARGLETLFVDEVRAMDAGLADALEAAHGTFRPRAFAGAHGFFREAWGPGWALVGDASYFKDPLTAHGISDALRDAELLARAAVRGTELALAEYQASRDRLSAGLMGVTERIASFRWTLSELGALHKQLSREMGAEVDEILSWDGALV